MDVFFAGLVGMIIYIAIAIVIILICRELVAWYTKRNIQIANQERIIQLLNEQIELLKSISGKSDE